MEIKPREIGKTNYASFPLELLVVILPLVRGLPVKKMLEDIAFLWVEKKSILPNRIALHSALISLPTSMMGNIRRPFVHSHICNLSLMQCCCMCCYLHVVCT